MPRTKTIIKRYTPALRSAPIAGAGVVRNSRNTMSNNSTIFRLLKVPKYAKRTLATLAVRKNEELEAELGRLKEDWMEQEKEIEWLREELERVMEELRVVKGEGDGDGDGGVEQALGGKEITLTEKEKEEMGALWEDY